jgi:hypothetical protein
MKVTIEFPSREDAINALRVESYIEFFDDFGLWLSQSQTSHVTPEEIRVKYRKLTELYGIENN